MHTGLVGGTAAHFEDDRVTWAAGPLGGFEGKRILEIGPFEAYNSWQFEQLGAASVLSIESSWTNFMRCLVVKNALDMQTVFQLGCGIAHMNNTSERYDAVWLSGVLYHLTDPVAMLRAAAQVSDCLFVWSHYHTPEMAAPALAFFDGEIREQAVGDRTVKLHRRHYHAAKGAGFSGGKAEHSYWMERQDILGVVADLGFDRIDIGVDDPGNPSGAAFYFLAQRSSNADLNDRSVPI